MHEYSFTLPPKVFTLRKAELTTHSSYKRPEDARAAIFEWIEVFYNRERIHSSIGYKTPIAYEKELMKDAA